MHIENLGLYNFRNYDEAFFTFSEGLNCIVGKNGSGKTNLLDAIYFLALAKSSIQNQDLLSIRFGEDICTLEGNFYKDDHSTLISCGLKRGAKKSFLTNGKAYERLSDHIGKYTLILISPNDTDLIRDGAETRRKLFDGILAQFSPNYLQNYLKYNRALDQRNSLLKQFAEEAFYDKDLLQIYTEDMLHSGRLIFEERKRFLAKFLPIFTDFHQKISEEQEIADIRYISELDLPDFNSVFERNIERDLAAQRTTMGIHRDDYEFIMNDVPIKKFGSQGQRKTFIMALKLAQFNLLEKEKGFKPILLLDDIFDKLDEKRINQLLEMIKQNKLGQVFITDARPERTKTLIGDMNANFIYT